MSCRKKKNSIFCILYFSARALAEAPDIFYANSQSVIFPICHIRCFSFGSVLAASGEEMGLVSTLLWHAVNVK